MQSIEISHHQLTASLQTQIVRDLGYFRELVCDSAEFHLGSLCAGSGIERKAILKLQQFWAKEFDIDIAFTNKYAAESVKGKQQHLKLDCDCESLFGDVEDIKYVTAYDLKSRNNKTIPYVHGIIAGFPCVDRSPQNPRASNNLGCVAKGEGKTGGVFADIAAVISKNSPLLVILENVTSLKQTFSATGADTSDVTFIKDTLQRLGYVCFDNVVASTDYGSETARTRVYIVGIKADRRIATALRNYYDRILQEMKIGRPFHINEFINFNAEKNNAIESRLKFDEKPEWPFERTYDTKEHQQFYDEADLTFPPEIGAEHGEIYIKLSVRQKHLLYFIDRAFPASSKITFVDVNESMSSLLTERMAAAHLEKRQRPEKKQLKQPWHDKIPCITSKSAFVMRVKEDDGTQWMRLLHAWEQMALMGWHVTDWAEKSRKGIGVTPELVKNMSGNAFNAFAFWPVFAASIACLGHAAARARDDAPIDGSASPGARSTSSDSD